MAMPEERLRLTLCNLHFTSSLSLLWEHTNANLTDISLMLHPIMIFSSVHEFR